MSFLYTLLWEGLKEKQVNSFSHLEDSTEPVEIFPLVVTLCEMRVSYLLSYLDIWIFPIIFIVELLEFIPVRLDSPPIDLRPMVGLGLSMHIWVGPGQRRCFIISLCEI